MRIMRIRCALQFGTVVWQVPACAAAPWWRHAVVLGCQAVVVAASHWPHRKSLGTRLVPAASRVPRLTLRGQTGSSHHSGMATMRQPPLHAIAKVTYAQQVRSSLRPALCGTLLAPGALSVVLCQVCPACTHPMAMACVGMSSVSLANMPVSDSSPFARLMSDTWPHSCVRLGRLCRIAVSGCAELDVQASCVRLCTIDCAGLATS